MTNETTITVRGYAGNDPILQETSGGEGRTSFRIGSTRSHRSPDGAWVDSPTVWFTVKIWGQLATKVCQTVRKGTPLLVRGRLEQESWLDREGLQRTGQVLRADSVAVDLSFGRVTYTPGKRPADREGDPDATRREDGGLTYEGAGAFVTTGAGGSDDHEEDPARDDVRVPDTLAELEEAPF